MLGSTGPLRSRRTADNERCAILWRVLRLGGKSRADLANRKALSRYANKQESNERILVVPVAGAKDMNVRCTDPVVMRRTVKVPEEGGRRDLTKHPHQQIRVAGFKVG